MKRYFFITITFPFVWSLFVISFPFTLQGQEHININPVLLNSKWNAQWIAYPNVSLKDYGVFHFRKTFDLQEQPDKFITIHSRTAFKPYTQGNLPGSVFMLYKTGGCLFYIDAF